ncbi:MAG: XRE family transcriptional regulator [Zoogloeaceae bacterium]|jgi:predicted XRE-type DNA-binding protein|nr:XRE family transcriptional regulator [Zoogloeaceae bacterium]
MKIQTFPSVWDAICDTPAEAENMRLRADLMCDLIKIIQSRKLTQAEAAEAFGVTQPRVSDLMRGKIERFSLDALVNMAASCGLHATIQLAKAA